MWPEQKGSCVRSFKLIFAKLKKDKICVCTVAYLVVEIHAMIYNAKVRRLSTKFQVDTCQPRNDRSAHAQLRQVMIYNAAKVRRLSTKLQVDICKTKKR